MSSAEKIAGRGNNKVCILPQNIWYPIRAKRTLNFESRSLRFKVFATRFTLIVALLFPAETAEAGSAVQTPEGRFTTLTENADLEEPSARRQGAFAVQGIPDIRHENGVKSGVLCSPSDKKLGKGILVHATWSRRHLVAIYFRFTTALSNIYYIEYSKALKLVYMRHFPFTSGSANSLSEDEEENTKHANKPHDRRESHSNNQETLLLNPY